MTIELVPGFRFSYHGLFSSENDKIRTHRAARADTFANRLYLSDGGAFLITGYRGVGKTTFVKESIHSLKDKLDEYCPNPNQRPVLLDVHLNIAKPLSGVELMHSILRQLHKRLVDLKLLSQLPKPLQESLQLSMLRTSAQLALKSSQSAESSLGIKRVLSIGTKFTSGIGKDISYLAYDERSAENDLIALAHQLTVGFTPVGKFGLGSWFRSPIRLKLLFVFDELDKIEEADGADASLSDILHSLKTLFTTSGISFIFVAGYNLHERWQRDVQRGDSVYESVFAESHYLPATWDHVDNICDPFLANMSDLSDYSQQLYSDFKRFLAFNGRGIPRRILRGFYDKVRWDGKTANLVLSEQERRHIRFYADVHQILVASEEVILGEYAQELRPEMLDKQRLGIYYILDWILARGCTPFTLTELLDLASTELKSGIAPTRELAPKVVSGLVGLLQKENYLEEFETAESTTDGTKKASQPAVRYRLLNRRLIEMGHHRDTAENVSPEPEVSTEDMPILADRYQLLDVIGTGGSAQVYRALDRHLGRYVAVKLYHSGFFSEDSSLKERLQAEIAVQQRMNHPGIVSLLDTKVEGEQAYIVMEFVEGIELTELLASEKPLPYDDCLEIAHSLLLSIDYLHQQGVIWRDVKPSNIQITTEGRVIIMDFGSAQTEYNQQSGPDTTRIGFIAGTPVYMSPEQIRGEALTTTSDLFSLALVIFEMATGHRPWPETDMVALHQRWGADDLTQSEQYLNLPEELKAPLTQALRFNSEDRFQQTSDFLAALPPNVSESGLTNLVLQAIARPKVKSGMDFVTLTMRSPDEDESTFIHSIVPAPVAQPSSVAEEPGKFDPFSSEPSTETENEKKRFNIQAPSKLIKIDDPISITTPRSYALLIVEREDSEASEYIALFNVPVTLGRSPDSDLQLYDDAASRYHAKIAMQKDQFIIDELNSSNGVIVNGERVYQRQTLNSGDSIEIGNTTLRFEAPETTMETSG